MKLKQSLHIQVGIFISACLLVAMGAIFMLGNEESLFKETYTVRSFFDDVSGLRVGAPVQLAGLKVGMVSDIVYTDVGGTPRVEVIMKVETDYRDRIRSDSEAKLTTQGLLGDKFVFLTIGRLESEPLAENGLVPSKMVPSILDLSEDGQEVIRQLKAITASASDIIGVIQQHKESIGIMLDGMGGILGEVKSGDGLLHSIIYDDNGKDVMKDVARSAANINDITRRVNEGEGTLGTLARDPAVGEGVKAALGWPNRGDVLKSVTRQTLKENEKNLDNP